MQAASGALEASCGTITIWNNARRRLSLVPCKRGDDFVLVAGSGPPVLPLAAIREDMREACRRIAVRAPCEHALCWRTMLRSVKHDLIWQVIRHSATALRRGPVSHESIVSSCKSAKQSTRA